MGAPLKAGLDYFSLDVDFFQDEKIQFVSIRFGLKGELITIKLLCKIYRQGYYMNWNNDVALLFAKSVGDGCQHSFVNDLVYELLKRGFFDRSIFERFSILTSAGIQSRYFEACLRRKEVYYNSDFLLIDMSKYPNAKQINESETNLAINPEPELNGVNVYINSQSKVKESKVNNITPLPPLQGEQPPQQKSSSCTMQTTKDQLTEIWNQNKGKYSDALQTAILDWIKYKKEKNKQKAYKPMGFQSLLSQIKKNADTYGEQAVIKIITESMASNYQGIIWDKLQTQTSQSFQRPKQNRFVNYEQRQWNFEEMERMEMELLMKKTEA